MDPIHRYHHHANEKMNYSNRNPTFTGAALRLRSLEEVQGSVDGCWFETKNVNGSKPSKYEFRILTFAALGGATRVFPQFSTADSNHCWLSPQSHSRESGGEGAEPPCAPTHLIPITARYPLKLLSKWAARLHFALFRLTGWSSSSQTFNRAVAAALCIAT